MKIETAVDKIMELVRKDKKVTIKKCANII